jgi:hypothetical protein
VEVLVASGVSSFVLLGTLSVFVSGVSSWTRGNRRIDVETQSQTAVRKVADELREAVQVTVDADGNGITYFRPRLDGNGNFQINVRGLPVSDGVARRFFVLNGQLMHDSGAGPRTLCQNVILTDPLSPNGTVAYRPFVSGGGMVVRQLTVTIATRRRDGEGRNLTGRKRQTVFLRNVPS